MMIKPDARKIYRVDHKWSVCGS